MTAASRHVWQGQPLASFPRSELEEVVLLLDTMMATKTGVRMKTERAHRASSLPDLQAAIRHLDLNLERFRPWRPPSLTDQARKIASASTLSKSGSRLVGARSTGHGAMGDLLDES